MRTRTWLLLDGLPISPIAERMNSPSTSSNIPSSGFRACLSAGASGATFMTVGTSSSDDQFQTPQHPATQCPHPPC